MIDIITWYNNNKGLSNNSTRPIDGVIYHFTNNIQSILYDNSLIIGDWGYISFTRNPNLNYGKYRIELDYDLLKLNYKLSDYTYDGGWDKELSGDELEKAIHDIKNEEEIVALVPIEMLNKYIKCISVIKNVSV